MAAEVEQQGVQEQEPEWELYYWPRMAGRGDFVRLMFVEAGVKYVDKANVAGNSDPIMPFYKQESDGYPVLAPPIIKKGPFVMNQTPAILQYLGKLFGMYPSGPEDEAHAWQVNLVVADYMAEGHNAFHPVKMTATYDSQKEEAEKHVEQFCNDRLPRYLKYFEKVLKRPENEGPFFFGNKLTYVDIAVFHALRATEAQFPKKYQGFYEDSLEKFQKQMAERQNIKTFLASSYPFCGNSMM